MGLPELHIALPIPLLCLPDTAIALPE